MKNRLSNKSATNEMQIVYERIKEKRRTYITDCVFFPTRQSNYPYSCTLYRCVCRSLLFALILSKETSRGITSTSSELLFPKVFAKALL